MFPKNLRYFKSPHLVTFIHFYLVTLQMRNLSKKRLLVGAKPESVANKNCFKCLLGFKG